MVINLISYYSIKIYISNKKHEKKEYTEEKDIYYISEEKGKVLNKLNIEMKNRNEEIESLREKKINEITVSDGFKMFFTGENNIFEVVYSIPKFQLRFFVMGKKISNSYVFRFYKDN